MEVHTSLLIFKLSVFLLLHWFVSLTLKYSVLGYGKNLLLCMHFNRIPCEIKEKNNNFSFYLYHLLLSCFHILYELAPEQNADAICCVFFCARMEVDLITTDIQERGEVSECIVF